MRKLMFAMLGIVLGGFVGATTGCVLTHIVAEEVVVKKDCPCKPCKCNPCKCEPIKACCKE